MERIALVFVSADRANLLSLIARLLRGLRETACCAGLWLVAVANPVVYRERLVALAKQAGRPTGPGGAQLNWWRGMAAGPFVGGSWPAGALRSGRKLVSEGGAGELHRTG